MRSRFVLGGLCAAVLAVLLVTPPVWAQANLFTGKIGAGSTKVYSITTDTSAIIDILVTAAHETTDIDIFIFKIGDEERLAKTPGTDEDDEEIEIATENVLLRAEAGVLQIEKGVLSVGGATEVTICVTNVAGARSRFSALFTSPSSPGIDRARMPVQVRELGEFGLHEYVADAKLAAIQGFIQRHVEAKGR